MYSRKYGYWNTAQERERRVSAGSEPSAASEGLQNHSSHVEFHSEQCAHSKLAENCTGNAYLFIVLLLFFFCHSTASSKSCIEEQERRTTRCQKTYVKTDDCNVRLHVTTLGGCRRVTFPIQCSKHEPKARWRVKKGLRQKDLTQKRFLISVRGGGTRTQSAAQSMSASRIDAPSGE